MAVEIRPVRPEDREAIVKAFGALHRQSVYRRFFFPKRALSDRELQWVTERADDRKIVLVATTVRQAEEVVVGLGQYVRTGTSAEIAFVVADDCQGRGIASRMLRQLADIGRSCGIAQFEADVLADNGAMLKVFRRSGLPINEGEADGIVHVTLSLSAPARRARSLWRRVRLPSTRQRPGD